MTIIDVSDFNDRPYQVPNQSESPEFKDFIEAAETRILKSILGYTLWKEFSDAFDASEVAMAPALADKWADLRDGAEYEIGGKTYKYDGLKDLLKPAIYALWMPQGAYKWTNVGMQENMPRKDNAGADLSKGLDMLEFQVQYWNEYAAKVKAEKNGLYGFMVTNETDYTDWEFTIPEYKNRFSL
jgi:hypothetical protein